MRRALELDVSDLIRWTSLRSNPSLGCLSQHRFRIRVRKSPDGVQLAYRISPSAWHAALQHALGARAANRKIQRHRAVRRAGKFGRVDLARATFRNRARGNQIDCSAFERAIHRDSARGGGERQRRAAGVQRADCLQALTVGQRETVTAGRKIAQEFDLVCAAQCYGALGSACL